MAVPAFGLDQHMNLPGSLEAAEIRLISEPAKGSTFTVYLPQSSPYDQGFFNVGSGRTQTAALEVPTPPAPAKAVPPPTTSRPLTDELPATFTSDHVIDDCTDIQSDQVILYRRRRCSFCPDHVDIY